YTQGTPCPSVFFDPVGDLPGDCYQSLPSDISGDGHYVTVSSTADEPGSPTDGGLCPPLPGIKHPNEAAGWTRPCEHLGFFAPAKPGVGGLTGLGYLPNSNALHDESMAYGISRDGRVAVGYSTYDPDPVNKTKAVVFLPDGGHALASPDPSAIANDVSER